MSQSAPLVETAPQTLELVARSQIKIDITAILPLEQTGEAYQRLVSRDTVGRPLLPVQ